MENSNRLLRKVLKEGLEDEFLTSDRKKEFIEDVYNYSNMGDVIYRGDELKKIAAKIKLLTQLAEPVVLASVDEWFDMQSVKKDMKIIREQGIMLEKTAKEVAVLQYRLESAFDDIGVKLNKYFDMADNVATGEEEEPETTEEIPEEPVETPEK
jgi:hypothetical protein